MGIPSFFRWVAAKYPRVIRDAHVPKDDEIQGTSIEHPPLDLTEMNPNGEYDNLYLDMNGLIHPACHPEGKPQPDSEDEMIENVFMYVDRIFAIVRPRKLLYMAIDGVAPRAKMNQQRSRRFKSAKEIARSGEAEEKLREEWAQEGKEVPPPKKRWDHNAITPGTPFMARLAKALQYYVHKRVTTDPAWGSIKVIFSDASVPGEGEHKIMNYIRLQRAQTGYDPNMRHAMYGMDADLIMLGLATHEVNFDIIRETVVFKSDGKCHICGQSGHKAHECKGGSMNVDTESEDSDFQFLSISILREYLQTELYVEGTAFEWDFERVVDDFVFLCFFVGNDFLPHLPSLDIREGALEVLIKVYKQLCLVFKGYLTDHGTVNLDNAQILLKELSQVEDDIFKRRKQQAERREQNNIRNQMVKQRAREEEERTKKELETFSLRQNQEAAMSFKRKKSSLTDRPSKLQKVSDEDGDSNIVDTNETADAPVEAPVEIGSETPPEISTVAEPSDFFANLKATLNKMATVEETADEIRLDVEGWKERYYTKKFGFQESNLKREIPNVARAYIEGLCWVLLYYYKGCPSWGWYYPYHYAPFSSDLYDLGVVDVFFEEGVPFSPLSQLMGVLPALSDHLVPEPYRRLMNDKSSPILDFYPINFSEDLNGKRFTWQAIVLLPFIDESRLLEALNDVDNELSEEAKELNERGYDMIFVGMTHALSNEISSMYLKYDSVPAHKLLQKRKLVSPHDSEGLFGYISPYPNAPLPGETVKCVLSHMPPLQKIRSLSAAFFDPPYKPHMCQLLSGARVPDPILTQQDFETVRARNRFGGNPIVQMRYEQSGSHTTQYLPGFFKNRQSRDDMYVGQADLQVSRRSGPYNNSRVDFRQSGSGQRDRNSNYNDRNYGRGNYSQGYDNSYGNTSQGHGSGGYPNQSSYPAYGQPGYDPNYGRQDSRGYGNYNNSGSGYYGQPTYQQQQYSNSNRGRSNYNNDSQRDAYGYGDNGGQRQRSRSHGHQR